MNIAKNRKNMPLSEYPIISKGGLDDVTIGIDAASLTGDSIDSQTGLYTVTLNIVKYLARMPDLTLKLYSYSSFSPMIKGIFPKNVIYKVIEPKTFWMTGRV